MITITTKAHEQGSFFADVQFKDEDGAPFVPNDDIRWTLSDTVGNVIRDAVAFTPPDSSITIVLKGSDLAVAAPLVGSERRLLIACTYDSELEDGLPFKDEITFDIEDYVAVGDAPARRTSPDLVKAVLLRAYTSGDDLLHFIDEADALVEDMLVCAAKKGVTYTAKRLQLIETRVAAYLYTQSRPLVKSKSELGASVSFADQDYKGMASTLDPSGCMAALLAGYGKAGGVWLGRNRSRTRTYDQRDV